MSSPTQVAAVVIRAALSFCIFSAVCNLALAGPVARTTNATATIAPDAPPATTQPQARVYLFRGALGPIFSRGMDRLTKRLQEAGIRADVYEFTICRLIADQAIRDFRDNPAPIALIGHSMGGLCALTFAGILKSENIPVSLVVTIDPAQASPKVPLNVERFINIFLSDSILGGGDVVAERGYQGHYASFDLKQHEEVTHINIDKQDSIHEQLVTAIAQLAATPAKGEAVPLRYVVPPDAPIELWDSGTQQSARSGDTLQRLAALNHVPLWSLTQANQVSESAPLPQGQRVLVPRRLTPPPPVATSVASRPKR
ncbi:peptidoglycan-binding protein LysM [Bradyrhizobium sp. WSM 1738]|uniref:alpha/beta fold hydrolase n=1 Tax=Bradyrhizobium hereditatis TaxID=2821405 RepID=UPI001CE24AFC|nr:LysM peptidoglycan-binding domain-containing protein [Bradyrhizobium hereditatis]MCA6117057.1 peptidoglycan-binding protein LysM [Bradyrhizobium hereditatis]